MWIITIHLSDQMWSMVPWTCMSSGVWVVSPFGAGVGYYRFMIYQNHIHRVSLVLPCCVLDLPPLKIKAKVFEARLVLIWVLFCLCVCKMHMCMHTFCLVQQIISWKENCFMKLVLRGLILLNTCRYHQTCLLDISLKNMIALCMTPKITSENCCFCSCSRLPIVHFSPAVALMVCCASQRGLESLVFLIGLTRLSECFRGKFRV